MSGLRVGPNNMEESVDKQEQGGPVFLCLVPSLSVIEELLPNPHLGISLDLGAVSGKSSEMNTSVK